MAGNIKGITIEFAGETTKLDKALKDVNKKTRDIDAELKKVKNALKFNPTSVELWRQKQTLLNDKIKQTQDKLKMLKSAQKQMKADGVEKNSEEYRKLQREIIETTSKLKHFKSESAKIGEAHFRAAAEGAKQVGENLTAAGQALAPVSAAATAIVTAIGALTVKSAQAADDINTMAAKYHIGTEEIQQYSAVAGLLDVELETIAKAHVKLTKQMDAARGGSEDASAAFSQLRVSYRNIDGSLKDSDQVFNDVIRALGRMDNETERDAVAMTLLGKSASELNPLIEDQGESIKRINAVMEKYGLDFIDEDTLARANEFNDELDTMKAIGSVTLMTLGSQLAAYLLPALQKVTDVVGQIAGWLATLDPETLAMITTIAGIVAVAAPLLLILGQIAFAISSIMSLMAVLSGPIGIIIVAIAGLIAIGILLWKNWDDIVAKVKADWQSLVDKCVEIKDNIVQKFEALKSTVSDIWNDLRNNAINAWNRLKSSATTTFNNIKEAILKPIRSAKNTFKGIVDTIKGFFPLSIGRIFDNIKLPHFSVDGGTPPYGILGKGKAPSFNIEWYAKGGIFDSPSLIGVGEAGPEAVVPLDKLWGYLGAIAEGATGGNTFNIYGTNAREIALEVEKILIQDQKRRRLAWQ